MAMFRTTIALPTELADWLQEEAERQTEATKMQRDPVTVAELLRAAAYDYYVQRTKDREAPKSDKRRAGS